MALFSNFGNDLKFNVNTFKTSGLFHSYLDKSKFYTFRGCWSGCFHLFALSTGLPLMRSKPAQDCLVRLTDIKTTTRRYPYSVQHACMNQSPTPGDFLELVIYVRIYIPINSGSSAVNAFSETNVYN